MKKIIFTIIFLPLAAAAYYNPGKPGGFVNDFAEMMSVDQKAALEQKLLNFEKESGNEIAIVTIPSLRGDTIENFAVKLFEDWKIGKKDHDNGALLFIARDERQMRIEVGYGLEGALTDAQSHSIINGVLKPAFRLENYYAGIDRAVDAMMASTKGEYKPAQNLPSTPEKNAVNFVKYFFWASFILIWLSSILARSKSWWGGGAVGGIVGIILGLINGFLYFGLISLALLIPFGLLLDFLVSRAFQKSKDSGQIPPWWGGGRHFGGGFGGGGFGAGGFGGFGGGRSGGGGASGGW